VISCKKVNKKKCLNNFLQEYGGVETLYVPSERIWLPDIVLYNNAGTKQNSNLLILIHHLFKLYKIDGCSRWEV